MYIYIHVCSTISFLIVFHICVEKVLHSKFTSVQLPCGSWLGNTGQAYKSIYFSLKIKCSEPLIFKLIQAKTGILHHNLYFLLLCICLQIAPDGNAIHPSLNKKVVMPFNLVFQSCCESHSIRHVSYYMGSACLATFFFFICSVLLSSVF